MDKRMNGIRGKKGKISLFQLKVTGNLPFFPGQRRATGIRPFLDKSCRLGDSSEAFAGPAVLGEQKRIIF